MNNEKILTHVDLHMHSSFSDGSDSPQEIIDKLQAREIHTFALPDYGPEDCGARSHPSALWNQKAGQLLGSYLRSLL